MAQFMMIRHLDPDESKGGGTMIGYGVIEADSDEEAARKIEKNWGFTYKDTGEISTNWLEENKMYSIVKLVQPVKL